MGMPMSRPVHVNIHDDLKMRLRNAEWAAGERLPSEAELAAHYGVARMTVRQAIGALAAEGVLVRRQGIGTFAAQQQSAEGRDELHAFAHEMLRQGHEIQTRLIKASVERPPPVAREALRLRDSAACVMVRRVRLVDGCPAIVQSSWLPYSRFAGLDTDPLRDGSLYATLEMRYGVRIARTRLVFTALPVDEAEAAALGLQSDEPVLVIERTAYDGANHAVEFAESVASPGYSVDTIVDCGPAG
jgi:GntR family transcriptional regulator